LLCRFLLLVKRPPKELEASDEGDSLLRVYWQSLRTHQGPAVIVDLAFSAAIVSAVGYQWCRFIGLDARAVLTFGGVGGIAFGLAAQNLVGNFISGLLILVTQPFTVGDWIAAQGVQGYVRGITWSHTEIETEEGPVVRLPNGSVVEAKTSNRTEGRTRRLELDFPMKFPSGGFARCPEFLAELEDFVAGLDMFKERLVERPRAYFLSVAPPKVLLSVVVDNKGLETTDELISQLNFEAARHLLAQGCEIPGLEAKGGGD